MLSYKQGVGGSNPPVPKGTLHFGCRAALFMLCSAIFQT